MRAVSVKPRGSCYVIRATLMEIFLESSFMMSFEEGGGLKASVKVKLPV